MPRKNKIVQTRKKNSDETLLELRRHWKKSPSLFKQSVVKDLYDQCHSQRKVSEILGLSRTTIFHYIQKGKYPTYNAHSVNTVNFDVLGDFVNSLFPADPTKSTPPPVGDDVLNKIQCGDKEWRKNGI